jgi:hypothetical protein
MRAISQCLALISFAILPCFVGCGGDDGLAGDAHDEYIAESVELFEAELALDSGTSGVDQETREQGLLFRIRLLQTMGTQAAAAAPALQKLRDATRNPELKEAATEALAEIQG